MRPHIIVSGVIGGGKSTAAGILGSQLVLPDGSGLDLYLENFDDNPFLERYYADPRRWAVESQRFFLMQTAAHHRACQEGGGIQDHSVREVHLGFDRVLREDGALTEEGYAILDHLYHELVADLRPPTLVVHLEASLPTLISRISARERPYEQAIDPVFLERLAAAKRQVWETYDEATVIRFDTDRHDLRSDAGQEELLRQVRGGLAGG